VGRATNISIAGVGGQGIILAGDIISSAALVMGYDIKKNEVHGMAQRGGAVVSEIRFGKRIYSPLIPDGEVDILVALELLEALRHAHRMKPDGILIANELRLAPAVRPPGAPEYPVNIVDRLRSFTKNAVIIPAARLAEKAGNARAANTVLIGALSRHIDIPKQAWKNALEACLRPSLLEVNFTAFELGRRRGKRRNRS